MPVRTSAAHGPVLVGRLYPNIDELQGAPACNCLEIPILAEQGEFIAQAYLGYQAVDR